MHKKFKYIIRYAQEGIPEVYHVKPQNLLFFWFMFLSLSIS